MRMDHPAQLSAAFAAEITGRFGVLPNFFASAPAAAGLMEDLWSFTKSSYLDNPLPSLFKERLFVHLSRFCEARYCIVRHVGFLIGKGRPAGDAVAQTETVEQAMALLRRPVPNEAMLDEGYARRMARAPLGDMPASATQAESDLFDALTVMFIAPNRSVDARAAVRHAAGDRRFELLIVLLTFVRTAHYWSQTHPDLAYEPDMQACIAEYPELARLLLDASEARAVSADAYRHQLTATRTDLRDSQDRLKTVLEGVGEAFYALDHDGRFLFASRSALKMWGMQPGDVFGRLFLDAFPQAERSEAYEAHLRVMQTKVSERLETISPVLGRWVEIDLICAPSGGVSVAFRDIQARKLAELALRESESRLARELANTKQLQEVSSLLMGADGNEAVYDRILDAAMAIMHADFASLQKFDPDSGELRLLGHKNFHPDSAKAWERVSIATRAPSGGAWNEGDRLFMLDESMMVPDDREHFRLSGIGAYQSTPLTSRDGRLIGMMSTHWRTAFTPAEEDFRSFDVLVRQTADAVERADTAKTIRESEARFQQFATASAGGLWIRNAKTLAMEYVSPAIATIYGVEPDAFIGDIKEWAASIVPDDRDVAFQHIERARQGESVIHEFRIQRATDGSFRWIRDIDFPLRDDNGIVQRIGGIAEDITDTKLALEHQSVLLAELQHRVRNIMAIMQSITLRTARNASSVQDYSRLMAGRLFALARVQALLTRTAKFSVDMRTMVHDELNAQAHDESQYVLDGPDVALSPKAAEVLTLAIHELATNAVKYGALSAPDGQVIVRWTISDPRGPPVLSMDWIEQGPHLHFDTSLTRRRGFGSELIEKRIPYELQGQASVNLTTGGVRCHIEFPLRDGTSLLETDGPRRASVFGGTLDMSGEADLSGHSILVVDDDYYLATDTARALRSAGAVVLGPSPSEDAARIEMAAQRPDAVVLDINLGMGPSFALATTLIDQSIPFIFVTGYDRDVVPKPFDHIERLEKPVELRKVVAAIATLVKPRPSH